MLRRLLEQVSIGLAVLVLALSFGHGRAGAEERRMRFRPVPAESVAAVEARDEAAAATREAAQAAAGTHGVVDVSVDVSDATDSTDTAEVVEDEPESRSTTGEIMRFGSDVTVRARQVVTGDVVSFGGDADIRGTVRGDVVVMGGDVRLREGAVVEGDVVCMGGTLTEHPGSVVKGQRVTAPRSPGAKLFFPMLALVGTGVQLVLNVIGLLFAVGLAWLVAKLAPQRTQAALDQVDTAAGASFLTGLAVWALLIPSVVALALVIALLCITIIGIPLAAVVALAYVLFLAVSALWGAVVGFALLGRLLHLRIKAAAAPLATAVVWGAIAVHGAAIVADLFDIVPMFGFVGVILKVVHYVTLSVLVTLGAGALIRSEYRRRWLQEWWQRIRPARPNDTVPPPSAPPGTGIAG